MSILSGSKIRALREQKKWEQQDLAHAANIARSVVSRLERGIQNDFKLSIVVSLATALGVSVDDLLIDEMQMAKPTFTPELQVALAELTKQPKHIQNYAAGMIQGFISTLKKDEI